MGKEHRSTHMVGLGMELAVESSAAARDSPAAAQNFAGDGLVVGVCGRDEEESGKEGIRRRYARWWDTLWTHGARRRRRMRALSSPGGI